MIKNIFFFCLLVIACASCSTAKRTTGKSGSGTTTTTFAPSTPKSTDDGLSFATAKIITEKTENAGVEAEYEWVRQHYENYKVQKQALSYHDKKPFDVITITLADGKDITLYFDISNYFGKF